MNLMPKSKWIVTNLIEIIVQNVNQIVLVGQLTMRFHLNALVKWLYYVIYHGCNLY